MQCPMPLPRLPRGARRAQEAPTSCLAAAATAAGLGFWTARDGESDSVVSKLRFPRYAHVIRCA